MRLALSFILLMLVGFPGAGASSSSPLDCEIQLLTLQPAYKNEEKGLSLRFPGSKVKYFSARNRAQFEVKVDAKGKLLDRSGKPFSTRYSQTSIRSLFVLALDDRFLMSNLGQEEVFHHSSPVAGAAVASAGKAVAEDGILYEMWNTSGHYKPNWKHIYFLLRRLHAQGVPLVQMSLNLHFQAPDPRIVAKFVELGMKADKIRFYDDDHVLIEKHFEDSANPNNLWL